MNSFSEIQHVDIPFDELKIFEQSADHDEYQQILIETLLLSTLAKIHHLKSIVKTQVLITAKSIWFIRNDHHTNKIKSLDVLCIVKSSCTPEMVIITQSHLNNFRITTSSETRCHAIISGISYQWNIMGGRQLPMIEVQNSELSYFERTSDQKIKGKNINIKPYPKIFLKYQKPFNGITNIYGLIKFTSKTKVILEKQLYLQNTPDRQHHKAYVARIIEDQSQMSSNQKKNTRKSFHLASDETIFDMSFQNDQSRYICHYISRQKNYMGEIYEHRNVQFIQELIYARATQYKVQIFFQFGTPLYDVEPTPTIFRALWDLYDKIKAIDPERTISTAMFLIVDRQPIIPLRQEFQERQAILNRDLKKIKQPKKKSFIEGKHLQIVARQFRYQFLREAEELHKFKYELAPHFKQQKNEYFTRKMFTLGIILYELFLQKTPFEYIVPNKKGNFEVNVKNDETSQKFEQLQKQTFDMLITMKSRIEHCTKTNIYPEYSGMGVLMPESGKQFVQKLIFRVFESEFEMLEHGWLKCV